MQSRVALAVVIGALALVTACHKIAPEPTVRAATNVPWAIKAVTIDGGTHAADSSNSYRLGAVWSSQDLMDRSYDPVSV